MEDERFFRIRETLWVLMKNFVLECEKLNLDPEEEIDVISSEVREEE